MGYLKEKHVLNLYTDYKDTVRTLKRNPRILILSYTLISVGTGLVTPLFVRYLETLGATPSIIGALEGLDYLLLSLGLVGGYIADKFGRRKLIITTHFIFAFSLLWFIFARNWMWVIPGILMLGARTLSLSAIDTVMADDTSTGERGKVYSLMWMFITLATIISSIVLVFIVDKLGVHNGVKLGFMVYFAITLITAMLFYFRLEETHFHSTTQSTLITPKQFVKDLITTIKSSSKPFRLFLLYYLAETPARMILMTYYVLYLVHVANASDALTALVFSVAMIVYLLAQIRIGPTVDRVNRAKILSWFISLTILSSVVFTVSYQNLMISVISCVFMIATIFLEQYMHKIFMADVTVKESRGTSLGLIRTIIGLESALSVVIGGILFELNPSYPFVLSIISLFISLLVLKKFQSQPTFTSYL